MEEGGTSWVYLMHLHDECHYERNIVERSNRCIHMTDRRGTAPESVKRKSQAITQMLVGLLRTQQVTASQLLYTIGSPIACWVIIPFWFREEYYKNTHETTMEYGLKLSGLIKASCLLMDYSPLFPTYLKSQDFLS